MPINLLPKEIQRKGEKERFYFRFKLWAVLLLLLVGMGSLASFMIWQRVSAQLATIDRKVQGEGNFIENKRVLEGKLRSVKLKIAALSEHFAKINSYSGLLGKIDKELGSKATLTTVELRKEGECEISGSASSFDDLDAVFEELSSWGEVERVSLDTVSKDFKSGKVNFSLSFYLQ